MDTSEISNLSNVLGLFEADRIILLIFGFVAIHFIVKFINKLGSELYDKIPSKRLLILQINTIIGFVIYILGFFIIVYVSLKPPKELIFALGGSAAVAIGFALKDIVASIIAGLILLFDRPFQVGDRVSFGEIYGEISKIGLRAVRLVTLDDSLVTIPNSMFLTGAVSSGNSGALDMMIIVDFHLSPEADLRKARDLLYEVVVTSKYAFLKKPTTVVMSEVNYGEKLAIQLKVKAYVIDVMYEKAFQTDIILRGTELLQKNKVQRPSVLVEKYS